MAIELKNKLNTLQPTAAYEFGDITDDTGANDGTPVNRAVYADFHQFFAKLASEAGITLNGLPESTANGFQYFESLNKLKTLENKVNSKDPFLFTSVFDTASSPYTPSRITASENFVYVLVQSPSTGLTVYQIDSDLNGIVGQIDSTDLNYAGDARDVFFDRTSGNLYILTQTGAQVGFLVYDENLAYIPALSNTNINEVDLSARSISVSGTDVFICGDEIPFVSGLYLRFTKSTAVLDISVSTSDFYIETAYSDVTTNTVYLSGEFQSTGKKAIIIYIGNLKVSTVFYDEGVIVGTRLFYNQDSKKFYQRIGSYLTRTNIPSRESFDNTVENDLIESSDLGTGAGSHTTTDICFFKGTLYSVALLSGEVRRYDI